MRAEASRLGRLALRCQPDSRLVALSREGSEPAFEEIVGRYRAGLVAFAAAIVPSHRAEDVVQESLAKAHSALHSGDAEINLRPWLYTIVRNRALNDLRDQPIHEHLDESYDGVPQPPDVAARREELSLLIAKMKGLPEAQRKALVARELEGRSHEEIAAALAITPGAVRGLIFRARTSLRDVAGWAVPMPAMRYLVGLSGSSAGGAAIGAVAGGGGSAIVKLGTSLTVAALAVGSGVALHERGSGHYATAGAASSQRDAGHRGSHHAPVATPAVSSTASNDQTGDIGSRGGDGSSRGSGTQAGSSGDQGSGSGDSSPAPSTGSSGTSTTTSGGDGGGSHSGSGGGSGDGGGSGSSSDGGGSGSSSDGGGSGSSSDGGGSGSGGDGGGGSVDDGGSVSDGSTPGGDDTPDPSDETPPPSDATPPTGD